MEALTAYISIDRQYALIDDRDLPEQSWGTALFADISGFTPLTEALVHELGPQRGAEELTRHLNTVYDALINELYRYSGCVISFSGDAITCWFDGDPGLRATACGLAMHQAMQQFTNVMIPSGRTVTLSIKAAVATGSVRRFVVGDPQIQFIDVLAGATLEHLAAAEHQANKGEVVLDSGALESLGANVEIAEWRVEAETGERFGVVNCLVNPVEAHPWVTPAVELLREDIIRPWLLPPVYERLQSGQGEFLAELRPAVALFLRFGGIDFDDPGAREQLDQYVRWVQSVLQRYESYLLQLTIGDKGCYLYTVFGAMIAHEDDTVRTVSAALELLKPPMNFITTTQIGISQGRMRTGAYGGSMRRTYGVLGDEVNLSARLMQSAQSGQILASLKVWQSAAHAFVWERLPDIRVKGKSEPISIYSPQSTRMRRVGHLQEDRYSLPMVGRTAELQTIAQKLDHALHGRGQVISVIAEAGMGKSRLVAEIIRMANNAGMIGYVGASESYGTNTSYLAWQTIWRDFFDFDPVQPIEEQQPLLAEQLRLIDPELMPRLPLLGAVLNVTIPDNDLTSAFDAKLRKTSLESLLVDCVRGRTHTMPLILVLEDCHWLDPLSRDLVEVIGRAIATLPVLLVMAYRPPDTKQLPPLISQLVHHTAIHLVDFTPAESEQLIRLKLEQVYGVGEQIPQSLLENITNRAEGNPFYIEELLNYLRDRGISPHETDALAQLDLPTSLHSLILSRIDQLSESQKTTLKVASVIGRLFRAAVLWGSYPAMGNQLRVMNDLEALNKLELTIVDAEPETTYLFKHIVTQEVAYESLPYAMRAILHDQIGQYIEHADPEIVDQVVDLLAFHFDRSENITKKRFYLLQAGQAAQADYSNAAAIDYYQRVLPLLAAAEQVPVMLKLGRVLEVVGQWREAGELYQRILEQTEQLQDRHGRVQAQTAIGDLLRKQGHYTEAGEWLEQARAGFEELGDKAGMAQVLHYAGTMASQQGDYAIALSRWEQSLAIRQELNDKLLIGALIGNMGIVANLQGNQAAARTLYEQSLAIRRETNNRWLIANSLNNLGNLLLDEGNIPQARARLEEAVSILRAIGDRWAIANTLNNLGNVVRTQQDYATAQELYAESLQIYRELGDRQALAYLLEDTGIMAALRGQAEHSLLLIGAAMALRDAIHAPLSPVEQVKLDRSIQPAYTLLGETGAATILEAGKALPLDETIVQALRMLAFRSESPHP